MYYDDFEHTTDPYATYDDSGVAFDQQDPILDHSREGFGAMNFDNFDEMYDDDLEQRIGLLSCLLSSLHPRH
jgi:hypothetical protein